MAQRNEVTCPGYRAREWERGSENQVCLALYLFSLLPFHMSQGRSPSSVSVFYSAHLSATTT